MEKKIILKVVEDSNWNRKRAAKRLKISYRALLYKLKQAGVHSERRGIVNKTEPKPDAPADGTESATDPAVS